MYLKEIKVKVYLSSISVISVPKNIEFTNAGRRAGMNLNEQAVNIRVILNYTEI
jgi:hypothetical protein